MYGGRMNRSLYILVIAFVPFLIDAAEKEPKGGSARMPQRSISKGAPGLVPSASHDDLRAALLHGQVASRDTPVVKNESGEEVDLEESFTRESSFGSITGGQRADHAVGSDALAIQGGDWLTLPDDTVKAVKKMNLDAEKAYKSTLPRYVALLERAFKEIFATDSPGVKEDHVKKNLWIVLHDKYPRVPVDQLMTDIRDEREKRKKQSSCCVTCCVIQ
jgi:hypothetical protein